MGTTYTAWDGNEYEWPPPKGWYQAIDNRWWAPDTGPAAMGESPQLTDQTMYMEQETEIQNPAMVKQQTVTEPDLPAWAKPNEELTTQSQNTSTFDEDYYSPKKTTNYIPYIAGGVGVMLFMILIIVLLSGGGDSTNTAQQQTTQQQGNQGSQTTQGLQGTQTTQSTQSTQEFQPFKVNLSEDNIKKFNETIGKNNIEISGDKIPGYANSICTKYSAAQNKADFDKMQADEINTILTNQKKENVDLNKRFNAKDVSVIISGTLHSFCPEVANRLEVPNVDAINKE